MTTFRMEGNSLLYRIWKRRFDKAQVMIKRYEDTVVDISSVTFPTASLMVIKFTTTNNGNKYELVLQGKYAKQYKKSSEGIEVQPFEVNAESIIRTNLQEAYQINE